MQIVFVLVNIPKSSRLGFIWLPDASKHLHTVPILPGLKAVLSEVLFVAFCPGECRGKDLQLIRLLNPYLFTIHVQQIELLTYMKQHL
jgi:hypothetical protein